MLPSAFQVINFPVQYAFEQFEAQTDANNSFRALGWYAAGMIAAPLNTILTPVTIIADPIIGAVEALFAYFQTNPTLSPADIAWKKMVASPIQQIIHFGVTAAGIPFVLVTILFWTILEGTSEILISILPDALNHKQINIFYNGGMRDPETNESAFD
jgi:hypothetical protein